MRTVKWGSETHAWFPTLQRVKRRGGGGKEKIEVNISIPRRSPSFEDRRSWFVWGERKEEPHKKLPPFFRGKEEGENRDSKQMQILTYMLRHACFHPLFHLS